jgi:hypothetical protein
MPCEYYSPQEKLGIMSNDLNELTQMLCYVLAYSESRWHCLPVGETAMGEKIEEWWKQHKTRDNKRRLQSLKEEKNKEIRERVLNNLTDEEKEALDL